MLCTTQIEFYLVILNQNATYAHYAQYYYNYSLINKINKGEKMDFNINRLVLLDALTKVSRAVSLKSPLPILTGIKFDLLEDGLVLTASDSDISIQTTINEGIIINQTGSVVLSSKYILEIIRKIDGDTVHIQVVDGTLTRITSESSLFDLNGSKSFDFPRIDLNKNGKHFSMKSYDFKKIIEKTLFATSEQETRPVLTGVNFKVDQHKLVCIATDSYRLAQVSMPIEDDIQFNIVIPKKSLNQIIHIIEKDEMIDLYVSDRKVLFVIGQYLVLTRLIDGTYPNTSRLVEDQGSYTMSINSSALLGAISRASLLSDEQSNIVKLTMSPDENVLSSYSQEIGSVEENLTKAFYKGEPMTISFSAKYLADAIRSIGTETIQLRFTEKMRPFQITGLDVNDNIQVVLPVRTY